MAARYPRLEGFKTRKLSKGDRTESGPTKCITRESAGRGVGSLEVFRDEEGGSEVKVQEKGRCGVCTERS